MNPKSAAAGGRGEGVGAAGDGNHGAGEMFQLERLVHAWTTRRVEELARVGVKGVTAREDDAAGKIRPAPPDLVEQLLPVHLGHLEIQEEDVVRAALQLLQRLPGTAGGVDGVV